MNRLLAAGLLLLLSPLLLLIALAIVWETGRPVLFLHRRACPVYNFYYQTSGRWGHFDCWKFRTMTVERKDILLDPAQGTPWTLSQSDPRLTRVGKFLRATSLDELPQLVNIVLGEMNFIGPRPMLPHQAAQLLGEQCLRMRVKPGITGYAQVMGRNSIPWEDRLALDVWYVRHRSWRLDAWILYRTVIVWLRGEGLYGPDGINHDYGV